MNEECCVYLHHHHQQEQQGRHHQLRGELGEGDSSLSKEWGYEETVLH